MKFKQFVKLAAKHRFFGDTPSQDFCDDSIRPSAQFRDFQAWEDLRAFLSCHGAGREVYPAAQSVFDFWKKYHGQKS